MKPRPQVVDRILAAVRDAQRFCIVGHVRPDGDCIGCQIGLATALRNEGKDVTVWNEDRIPDKLAFLDPDHLLDGGQAGKKFDCVIAVDSASYERLGKIGALV